MYLLIERFKMNNNKVGLFLPKYLTNTFIFFVVLEITHK